MLIFHESGRLGNQLFQYSALKSLCKENESLILLGFSQLQSVFDGLEAKIINHNSSRLERGFYYRLYRRLDFLSQKKIITTIQECTNSRRIIFNEGLLKQLTFVKESYFQNQKFFDPDVIKSFKLKPTLFQYAQELLASISQEKVLIFVNVRRGDYLTWPDKDNPAVLPASYYQECIKIVNSKIFNPFFIFLSDDPFYVKDLFGYLENYYISLGSSFEDFAIMTQCQGGILSASTFAWWGAYFAKLTYPKAFFFAPKYWAGHRIKSWYPPMIESDFLTYIDLL